VAKLVAKLVAKPVVQVVARLVVQVVARMVLQLVARLVLQLVARLVHPTVWVVPLLQRRRLPGREVPANQKKLTYTGCLLRFCVTE
jgi:hypothetical protein